MNIAPVAAVTSIKHIGLLVNNYQLIESLRSALSSGTHAFKLVPGVIEEAIDDRAWLDRINRDGQRYTYAGEGDFRDFVTDPLPKGLGATVDEVRKYLGDSSNPIRNKFEELIKRGHATEAWKSEERTPTGQFVSRVPNNIRNTDESLEISPTICLLDTPAEPEPPQPKPERDRSKEPQAGDSIGYAVRRIGSAAENDPEKYGPIYDRLMAGEITAHAAMLEAELKPRKITIPLEPVAAWRLIKKHFRDEDLATIRRLAANGDT